MLIIQKKVKSKTCKCLVHILKLFTFTSLSESEFSVSVHSHDLCEVVLSFGSQYFITGKPAYEKEMRVLRSRILVRFYYRDLVPGYYVKLQILLAFITFLDAAR